MSGIQIFRITHVMIFYILESIIFYEKLLNSITCCRRAFPIDIGISVPETMVSPIIAPLGCKIYLFSPSP
ncbi:hypothetical protein LUZ60_018425 [Juncus effusus]|nr:hypothetical protein LUZ60_018425 [Juncus effusus]